MARTSCLFYLRLQIPIKGKSHFWKTQLAEFAFQSALFALARLCGSVPVSQAKRNYFVMFSDLSLSCGKLFNLSASEINKCVSQDDEWPDPKQWRVRHTRRICDLFVTVGTVRHPELDSCLDNCPSCSFTGLGPSPWTRPLACFPPSPQNPMNPLFHSHWILGDTRTFKKESQSSTEGHSNRASALA